MGKLPAYVVPDYKIYQVEGVPELERLERALHAKGLKDPWIRNEVWRYSKDFGTKKQRARTFFFRGFPLGLGLAVATVLLEKTLGGGGHGHDSAHGHEATASEE